MISRHTKPRSGFVIRIKKGYSCLAFLLFEKLKHLISSPRETH
jgi:hypothetical protein